MKNRSGYSSENFKCLSVFARKPGLEAETRNSGDGVDTPARLYPKEWSGQYCCVPLCRSSSGEEAERERLGMP